jgi:cellulose synthase/poly-beta-1,6-N-acetylglucosamine synthase-like glycosyltransferase
MSGLEITFWSLLFLIVYAYVLYPALLGVLARLRRRQNTVRKPLMQPVSIVVAAYNEAAWINRRLDELTEMLAASGVPGEIIVVSDGSTDDTAAIARSHCGHQLVRVVESISNRGKAAALNRGCALARNDILIFADARQTWSPGALVQLLKNFSDPSVGAVSGDLILQERPGVMAGVGLYWRYEKWLRKQESTVHSTIGVTGAICAVRRELFQPVPPGTLVDDLYWPLQVVMQRYRVVHDSRAQAFDRLPERTRDEFRRKVRTLSGNFQLLALLPAAFLPWHNPIWLQFVSHKLLRLVVPWALIGLLFSSAALPDVGYQLVCAAQCAFYLLGLAGICLRNAGRCRFTAAAASFLLLNAAAWLAFWMWVSGRAARTWRKVAYEFPPLALAAPLDQTPPPRRLPSFFGEDVALGMAAMEAGAAAE